MLMDHLLASKETGEILKQSSIGENHKETVGSRYIYQNQLN